MSFLYSILNPIVRKLVRDYTVHVEPGLFHGYPMFSFVKEGRQGEDEIIGYLKQ